MNKIYQKTFPAGKNAGFTLLELLVVVLIIAILAAIALPQYEKAVMKARVAKLLPWFASMKRGRDLYITNGGSNICLDLGAFAFADNSLPIPWYLSLFGYMGNINKNILADGATYAYHIQCDFDKNGYVTRIRKYHPTSHKLQETIEVSYK